MKFFLRLSPIWMKYLMFGVVFKQNLTFFTKSGNTMDRKVGTHFEIPPASLQCFISLSVVLLLPIYDHIFVQIAKNLIGNEWVINLLQRIGNIQLDYKTMYEIRRLRTCLQRIWPNIVLTLNSHFPVKILLEWWTLVEWLVQYFPKPWIAYSNQNAPKTVSPHETYGMDLLLPKTLDGLFQSTYTPKIVNPQKITGMDMILPKTLDDSRSTGIWKETTHQ